jgi:ABC-type taurine transport system substrate-binding protein
MPAMPYSRVRATLTCAVAALLLCASWGAAAASRALVFAVARLPLSLPIYVAEEQGFFAAEGVAVNVADCDIGRRCLDRMLAGGADLATAAVLPLVRTAMQGRRFAVVATIAAARNDAKLIVRRGTGIDSAAALAGRRVGTFVGTSAHFLLELSLLTAGVDPAKVTLVALEPEDAADALRAGRVDAIAVFEPFAWHAARALGDEAQVISDRRLHVEHWNIVASATMPRCRRCAARCCGRCASSRPNPRARRRCCAGAWGWTSRRWPGSGPTSTTEWTFASHWCTRWRNRRAGRCGRATPAVPCPIS